MNNGVYDIITFLLDHNLVKCNTKIENGEDSFLNNIIDKELLYMDYYNRISIYKVTLIGKMTPVSSGPINVYKFRKKKCLLIKGISSTEDWNIIRTYTNPRKLDYKESIIDI